MVSRTDVSQEWVTDPRISTVSAPATEFGAQDIVDTLRLFEERFRGQSEDKLLNATGKDQLSPLESTVITATLQNNLIEFESRFTPAETGTATSSTTVGPRGLISLIDTNADFIAANIQPGSFIVNWDDRSITDVRRVIDGNELECKAPVLGTDNDFDIGENYSIWNIVQCEVGGGNVIAVDEFDAPISAVLPSAFTQVITTRSTAGAVANLPTIELQLAEVHGQIQRSVYVDTNALAAGNGYQQTPFNTLSAALDYAQTNQLSSIVILSDITLDRDIVQFEVTGLGEELTLNANGWSLSGSKLRDLVLDGNIALNATGFRATDCSFADGVSGLHGKFVSCGMRGVFDIASSAALTRTCVFQSCYSELGGNGARPECDANGGAAGADISFRDWRGGLNLGGVVNANDAVSVGAGEGAKLTLLATNTAGDVSVRGNMQLTDNSAGSTVDTEALIRSQVWQALVADYNSLAGSMGEFVTKKLLTFTKWLSLK